jgi:ABC-2 type transport system ATP-binding protein
VNSVVLDQLISELRRKGVTILLCTHVMAQAEKICERIVLIHKGCKHLDATLPQIRERFDPRELHYEPLERDDFLAARLGRMEGVASVRPTDDGAGWRLSLSASAQPQALFRELALLGPARAIELARVSLDNVFVRVVRQAEGEAAAQAAEEELHAAQI